MLVGECKIITFALEFSKRLRVYTLHNSKKQ